MRSRPTLLLTRPAASSRRFLGEVRRTLGRDWVAVISPLMQTRFFDATVPPCDTIVFTSETAVRAVERLTRDRSALAWCVGPRSEAAALKAGYRTRRGPGDGAALAALIAEERPAGRVFCPAATHQAIDMAKALGTAGIDTDSAILYAQEACPPTEDAKAIMTGRASVILPLFSGRSADLAVAAFQAHTAPLLIAAISPQVADRARPLHPEKVAIARRPESPDLIAAIASLVARAESG